MKHILFLILQSVFLLGIISSCVSKKHIIAKSEYSKKADEIADRVIQATNANCWDQVTEVSWEFGKRKHQWNRSENIHSIQKGNKRIQINLNNTNEGIYFIDSLEITGNKKSKALKKAYKWWANDSFWLNPFPKFYDKGVKRFSYLDNDGKTHLVIAYDNNGKTGDLFDWKLDDDHLPTSWSLFVKIIPLKNYKVTWENWKGYPCGLKIASLHRSLLFNIRLKNVKIESM